jgi:hypothetical protein
MRLSKYHVSGTGYGRLEPTKLGDKSGKKTDLNHMLLAYLSQKGEDPKTVHPIRLPRSI